MAKRITITESKYADFTINIDGEEEITISFDQARRLRNLLANRIPAIRSKVAMKVQNCWRQVKASKYQIRLRLYTGFDGESGSTRSVSGFPTCASFHPELL